MKDDFLATDRQWALCPSGAGVSRILPSELNAHLGHARREGKAHCAISVVSHPCAEDAQGWGSPHPPVF
jgi:hypothetical protein